jgi:hypothetical protein
MHNAAPHPIVSAARFRRPNTPDSTIFPDLRGIPAQTDLQNATMQLASSVLLPKIGFDPLTHRPFI